MGRRVRINKLNRTDPKGNLYYVKLNTECGILYKLGFTTLESVEARMSYEGSDDWRYIDKVLMFSYLPDAFEVEQKLHNCLNKKKAFEKYSANKAFPLRKNGQTELYIEDVLGLDPYYSEKQKIETTRKLKDKKLFVAGKTAGQAGFENILVKFFVILLAPLGLVVIILMSILESGDTKKEVSEFFDRLTGGKRKAEEEDAEIRAKVDSIMRKINVYNM